MNIKPTKKEIIKIVKGGIFVLVFCVVPILAGFLFSFFFERKVLFESIVAMFALAYFFIALIRLSLKDNLYYRKGKYHSKDEFKISEDYRKYVSFQIRYLTAGILLVIVSIFLFVFYR
jgi:hypothetical protein